MSATMEPPSDESLVVYAFTHKITLKQFTLEKNACENSVLERWALKPSATDPARTGDDTWLNWKVYSFLWSRLFGDTLGQFPFKEPVEGRPLGDAVKGVRVAEAVPPADIVHAAETVQVAETVRPAETSSSTSTSSKTKSQIDAKAPRPTVSRQPTTRKAQPQKSFTLPADIQKRPAILDLDPDEMPQYSAIFPASITKYIFDKAGGVDGKAQVEVFHRHYKNCSINASLDSKRRIITVWSEPRNYTGTLTEEIEKDLVESAVFLAAYSNEAWKKETVSSYGPPMAVFFADWLKLKAKVQFGHDNTQPAAVDGKKREVRIEYHEGSEAELTRWWVAPAVPMNMTTGEAILVDPIEIAARGPLMNGENVLTIARKENDRRKHIAAYERKVRMIHDEFMGTTSMPEVYLDELEKSFAGMSSEPVASITAKTKDATTAATITAKATESTKNARGDAADLISLFPEEVPKPVLTLAKLERVPLAHFNGKPRDFLAELEAERDKKKAETVKIKANLMKRFAETHKIRTEKIKIELSQ